MVKHGRSELSRFLAFDQLWDTRRSASWQMTDYSCRCHVKEKVFPCTAHKTKKSYLNSIISNGLAPGGDGITHAVHSQLSAFHMMDYCLQESSRASRSDAVTLCKFRKTKPLLSVVEDHGARHASATAFLQTIIHHVEGRKL